MGPDPAPRAAPSWPDLVNAEPVVGHFDDGALLIVPGTGALLALNASGAHIFSGLCLGQPPPKIAMTLAERYGISLGRAERDVAAFLTTDPSLTGAEATLAVDESTFRFGESDDGFLVSRDGNPCLRIDAEGRSVAILSPCSRDLAREALLWVTAKLAVLRGSCVVHASAARTDGMGCIAFAGRSGAGKTTLARAFEKAGAELVCEDSFILTLAPARGPEVRLRRFEEEARVWAEALDERLEPGKVLTVDVPRPADESSLMRVDRILLVDRHRRGGDALDTKPLGPTAAAAAVLVNLFWAALDRRACARALERARQVALTIPVEELTVPDGVDRLPLSARSYAERHQTRKTASY